MDERFVAITHYILGHSLHYVTTVCCYINTSRGKWGQVGFNNLYIIIENISCDKGAGVVSCGSVHYTYTMLTYTVGHASEIQHMWLACTYSREGEGWWCGAVVMLVASVHPVTSLHLFLCV